MSDRPEPTHAEAVMSTPRLLALAALTFVVEIALFCGVGAIAHSAVGGGATGWLAALAATGAVVLLWGLVMAPRARFRPGPGPRVLLAAALCAGTAYGLVQAGQTWWGWFVGIAGLAVVAAQVVLPSADRQRA